MSSPVVPIAALQHHLYCPRQCALIHVDGVWVENEATTRGAIGHARADSGKATHERAHLVVRSIPLWSEVWGLSGRADTVECWPDGSIIPVEYKIGQRHGLTADVQVCAQALCLEEMLGASIPVGFVWYARPRQRRRVEIDDTLRELCREAIDEVRATLVRATLPVAPNDARCNSCQLLAHCLPDVVSQERKVIGYLEQRVFECAS